ncbi:TPA: hypothetical protein ACKQPR_003357 [Serratia odorifera]
MHYVHQRHHHRPHAIAARGQNTLWDADDHRQQRSNQHQRQRLHQFVPHAGGANQQQQPDHHRCRQPAAGRMPGQQADDRQH